MDNVTFFLETSADSFATWLLTAWRAPRSYKGYHLQALRDGWSRGPTPVRTLTAAAIYVSPVENERGNHNTSYPFEDALSFQLIPIANERVEVQAKIDLPVLLSYLADLIEDMAHPARWPQLRDTLSWRLNWYAETADGQAALEAFDARMRRLKDTPGQRAPFDEPPARADGSETTPAQPEPPRDEPYSQWDAETVRKIEDYSNQGKSIAFMVTETSVPDRTVVRIRKALAEDGRIKRKKDR